MLRGKNAFKIEETLLHQAGLLEELKASLPSLPAYPAIDIPDPEIPIVLGNGIDGAGFCPGQKFEGRLLCLSGVLFGHPMGAQDSLKHSLRSEERRVGKECRSRWP